MEKVARMVTEKGIVTFSKSNCCLCYAVNRLFQELGVTHPYVYEVDKDHDGKEIEKALIMWMGSSAPPLPVVFIGGKFVGSTNEVMSLHLSGSLIPLLKPYMHRSPQSN